MNVIQPFKRRIVIEAIVKALVFGLLIGLALSLGSALIFRFVLFRIDFLAIIITIAIGLIGSVTLGIIIYKKRFRANSAKLARRIDSLGLEERVITMIEYQDNPSYVAKV